MACPFSSGGITPLPGKQRDLSARQFRSELLDETFDLESFVRDYGFTFPKTSTARYKNKVQSYALASLIIEDFWTYLQTVPVTEALASLRAKFADAPYDEKVERFFFCCSGVVGAFQNKYFDATRDRNKEGRRTYLDKIFVAYFSVTRARYSKFKGVHFPSMKDLIALIARMAHVAPLVFERDVGRKPSQEELFHMIKGASTLHFCTQLMSNDRTSGMPLLSAMEGHKKANFDDRTRRFSPDYFEIRETDGLYSLHVKSTVIEKYRAHFEKAARRRARRNKPQPAMLGCPALYTGKIGEMFYWTCAQLERWL